MVGVLDRFDYIAKARSTTIARLIRRDPAMYIRRQNPSSNTTVAASMCCDPTRRANDGPTSIGCTPSPPPAQPARPTGAADLDWRRTALCPPAQQTILAGELNATRPLPRRHLADRGSAFRPSGIGDCIDARHGFTATVLSPPDQPWQKSTRIAADLGAPHRPHHGYSKTSPVTGLPRHHHEDGRQQRPPAICSRAVLLSFREASGPLRAGKRRRPECVDELGACGRDGATTGRPTLRLSLTATGPALRDV